MAWTDYTWKNKDLGNQYFQVKIYYAYRQDKDARKTEIYTHSLEIIPVGGSNIGYPDPATVIAGVGILGVDYDEKTFTGVRATTGGKFTYNLRDIYATIKHTASGSLEKSVFLQAKHKITTYVGFAPTFDWQNVNITNDIPKMKPLPNAPTGGNLTVEPGQTTATVSYYGFNIPGGLERYDVSVQPQGTGPQFVNNQKNSSYTKSGLRPNTKYTAYVRAVDVYGQVSKTISQDFTTKAYYPNTGTVTVTGIGPFQATAEASGFTFGTGGTWGHYEFSIQEQGAKDSWINTGQDDFYQRTNLKPNTTYKAKARLVDQYGQASEAAETTFTTPSDQAKMWIKKNGVWYHAKVWVKKNGQWQKVKKVWTKKNGQWQKGK